MFVLIHVRTSKVEIQLTLSIGDGLVDVLVRSIDVAQGDQLVQCRLRFGGINHHVFGMSTIVAINVFPTGNPLEIRFFLIHIHQRFSIHILSYR